MNNKNNKVNEGEIKNKLQEWKQVIADFNKKMGKSSSINDYDSTSYDEKYNKIMENSNKMLEECITKNPDRVSDACVREINKMIESNKRDMIETKKCTDRNGCGAPRHQISRVIPVSEKNEPARNNRFIIDIESKLYSPDYWVIKKFWHDDNYRMNVTIMETCGVCVPYLLDKSIEDGVQYTIRKKILSPTGKVNYTVVYTGCTVVDYVESGLDYDNDDVRTVNIIFDYKDYKYEF